MSTAEHSLARTYRAIGDRAGGGLAADGIRRVLDVAIATTVLLVTVPLLLAIVAAIRVEGGGPAIFRQTRAGRGLRPFAMLKFRTMHPGADGSAPSRPGEKCPGDTRITRVGRLLRRTSLDELPQLVNVLRGEMTIVGPRPLPLDEVPDVPLWATARWSVPPGLTGLWQVSGRSDIAWDARMDLDVHYVLSRSLTRDARLIIQTVGAVVSGRGAY